MNKALLTRDGIDKLNVSRRERERRLVGIEDYVDKTQFRDLKNI